MRLINVETFEIEEFLDADIPRYAILSHTWGREEVEFYEWRSDAARLKDGFAKITGARDQARVDGLPYLWIDTCCIDKRSSAELSEAINSMFAWYRDADVCYVYLADVDVLGDLEASKWFTRGWTLQELLAPQNLRLFSCSWAQLGTKEMLADQLSRISLIDVSYLTGEDLRTASIAQRMSWASKRTTKRREDMAYCLLGIFDINMPLLYGEGDKAFLRLQEEILKKTSDESIFAWWQEQVAKLPVDKKRRHDRVTDARLGLLARSPRAFAASASVIAWPEDGRQFSVTNTSVELKTYENSPIRPPSNSWKIVRLQCRDLKRPSSFICIPVEYIPDLGIYCRLSTEVPLFVLPLRNVSMVWPFSQFGQSWKRDIIEERVLVSKERPVIPKKLPRLAFDVLVEYAFLQPKGWRALAITASAIDFRPNISFDGVNAKFDWVWQGIQRDDPSKGFAARLLFTAPNGKRVALYLETTAVLARGEPHVGDSKSLRIDCMSVVGEDRKAAVDQQMARFEGKATASMPSGLLRKRSWRTSLDLDGFRVNVRVRRGEEAEAADSGYIVELHIEPSELPWASIIVNSAVILLALCLSWLLTRSRAHTTNGQISQSQETS